MKNGKPNDLQARLERLEADVKEIKALLLAQQESKEPRGWKAVVGTFANDPVFDEISRLGAEIREKEREKARRARARQKS